MYYSLAIIISIYFSFVHSYKPVVLLHGIMTGAEIMELIKNRIQEVGNFSTIPILLLLKLHYLSRNILEPLSII